MRLYISVLLALLGCSFTACADGNVTITLAPEVVVESAIVKLVDLARVEGTNQRMVALLGDLEIAELPNIGDVDRVSRTRVEYLLLLEGISKSQVQVDGEQVNVTRGHRLTLDEKVTQAIRVAFAEKLNVPTSDATVHLTRPLGNIEPVVRERGVDLRVFPFQSARLGASVVRLGAYSNGRLVKAFNVAVEVGIRRLVPMATRSIGRNQPLTDDDVEWKLATVRNSEYLPEGTELVGRSVITNLKIGEVLKPSHLSRASSRQNAYVIRARDNVKIVAKKGPLRVTMGGGIAMQRARIGDTIRVQNPTSKRVIMARLINADTAELQL